MKNVEVNPPHSDLAFFADSMHGSLARKLRIFGLDTTYNRSICDDLILRQCDEEGRILLTSDIELFARSIKKRINAVLLQGHSDKENLIKIFRECKIKGILFDSGRARCPLCNRELEKKKPADLIGEIPPKSSSLSSSFYQCRGCQKVYWDGSHKAALVALAESVNRELNKMTYLV